MLAVSRNGWKTATLAVIAGREVWEPAVLAVVVKDG